MWPMGLLFNCLFDYTSCILKKKDDILLHHFDMEGLFI